MSPTYVPMNRIVEKNNITPAGSEIRGKRPHSAQKSRDSTGQWTDARNSTEQVTNTCLKGVLVVISIPISIPIFTSQLEKAREATDLANIRAAYSELTADALSGDAVAEKTEGKIKINASTASAGVTTYTATVTLVQKVDGWTTTPDTIGGMSVTAGSTPKAGGSATITIKSDGTAATLAFSS